MPIYAYACSACGHARDVLQKLSDPVLVTCPVCGADSFKKQLTAAGFQLKGSGWYATDFRNGSAAATSGAAGAAAGSAAAAPEAGGSAGGSEGGGSSATGATPCGASCACH